jgi:hypothetical protein
VIIVVSKSVDHERVPCLPMFPLRSLLCSRTLVPSILTVSLTCVPISIRCLFRGRGGDAGTP